MSASTSDQLKVLGPWEKYKRYSDNVKVEARLIEIMGLKYLEVKESRGDEITCPGCKIVLSKTGGKKMPRPRLLPADFHVRYKMIDPD